MADQTADPAPLDLGPIRADLDATTNGDCWHWSGNIDTGEPYLATWVPGAGRCGILAIGSEERSTTGPAADRVRADADEYDLGDSEDVVRDWATDQFGEPASDPRLWFSTDLMAAPARDLAVFEVAPSATSRQDPAVYRADVVGIRHPDAVFIERAPRYVRVLLAEVQRLREEAARPAPGVDEYVRQAVGGMHSGTIGDRLRAAYLAGAEAARPAPMWDEDAAREAVEETLGEHAADLDETAVWQGTCACGWRMSDPAPFPDEEIHYRHVTEAVLDAVLALLPGRTEAEVRGEALRAFADREWEASHEVIGAPREHYQGRMAVVAAARRDAARITAQGSPS